LKKPAAFIVTLQLRRREQVFPKHGYLSAKLHDIIFHKTALFIITATLQVNLKLNFSITLLNPLVTEVCALFTLQKTGDLNGCPLLCMFLANNFR
jgi:hypothetical protein